MRIKTPEIIYEDEAVLVCRKEAGVPVQTAKAGQADMVSVLKNYRAKRKGDPYIGLVHRLDQPVEGVMVFAKTKSAAADLSGQVSHRTMEKYYLAVLNGVPKEKSGVLSDYLLKDAQKNTSRVVKKDVPGAKAARLSYEVLLCSSRTQQSLVRIQLHTGRHHQIRVQFSHAGTPLYGDTKYGQPLLQGVYCPVALCSYKIAFVHPVTKRRMEFQILPRGQGFTGIFPNISTIL